MILNSWQRITRVLPGKPFGDKIHGDYNSATIPTLTKRSCSGTSGNNTISIGSSGFSDGDVVVIIQTRGTGHGQWEINQVISGGGTTNLTLKKNLQYTYTDSGASQAQIIELKRYDNITIPSGTWTIPAWDADINGIFPIAGKTLTPTGTIVGIGANGTDINDSGEPSNQGGFRGGVAKETTTGGQGEGYSGDRNTLSGSANGNGGGGGVKNSGVAGGGGGGNGTAGTSGSAGSGGTGGTGGGTAGTADLTTFDLGGGGGGGSGGADQGSGANSGAGLMLFIENINTPAGINLTGGDGGSGSSFAGGGAGSGGPLLIVTRNAALGSGVITANGGIGGIGTAGAGGPGGVGRIAIHHSGVVTGTTSPTFEDIVDPTLIEALPGAALMALL